MINKQADFTPGNTYMSRRQLGLAGLLKGLGKLQEAKKLLKADLEAAQTNFAAGNPFIAQKQTDLAKVLEDLGELENAEQLYSNAYQTYIDRFGPDHHNTQIARQCYEAIRSLP